MTLDVVLREARRRGFLGGDPAVHARHARQLVRLGAPWGTRVLDLGSGAGVPGLVLAREVPEVEVVLLDARERRCAFLREVVEALGWSQRVQVLCGRGEEVAQGREREAFDAVVARAFGPPPVTAEIGGAFVAPGGILVVSEPPEARVWPAERLAELGFSQAERRHGEDVHAVVLRKVGRTPAHVPRRVGVPARRPLW